MNENKKSFIILIIFTLAITVVYIGGMIIIPKPKNDKDSEDYRVNTKALYGTEWTRYVDKEHCSYLSFDDNGDVHCKVDGTDAYDYMKPISYYYDGYLDGDKVVITHYNGEQIEAKYGDIPFIGGKTLIIEGSYISGLYLRKE
jgi:hypothetical protein